MKTRASLLGAAFVIVSAAAPAAAQSSGRAEPSEGRRTSERDPSRDDARGPRDARDARGGGRADGDEARVAAPRAADRELSPRDSAEQQPGGRDEAAGAAPATGGDARDDAAEAARVPQPGGSASGTRSWLARGSSEPALAPSEAESSSSTGLTVGAVLLVLGLAAAAIAMRFKKRDALPLAPSEARLTVLSSSRVGPKAFAVTAHVNGRPLLLGVTDHTVTLLGWLDAREPSLSEVAGELPSESEPEEELPEDYPGSALRASKVPTFASSSRLERFREVLRGAEEARTDLPMRPSYAPAPLDAAALLASQTTDVVTASQPSVLAKTPQPGAVSLRRKRRSRESLPPRDARQSSLSRAAKPADASVEGQVAGLRALRNGG